MAYGDFKDLTRGAATGKVIRGKSFNIAKNRKFDGYQKGLALMVYDFFDGGTFIDNLSGADLADMQLISKLNKGISFLLRVIDIQRK